MKKVQTIRFTVSVPCHIPFSDEVKNYEDHGFIILPESYCESGSPTRLVISCHGAGGSVTTDDAQCEHQLITQYLVANGYAVMGVNGLPEEFADEYGISIYNNIGSPIAVESNVNAYHYCQKMFNLHKEVIVWGASMGGISSTNLVLSEQIPVLAQGCFCPVLDTYNEIFLHPWSNGLPKTALGILYSLSRDSTGDWIYEEEKVCGYNPAQNPKRKHYPCPLFFCHCVNDDIVSPDVTVSFIEDVKQSGKDVQLLLLPDGYHEPQAYGTPVANPSGNIMWEGHPLSILPAVEAAFQWIRKWG